MRDTDLTFCQRCGGSSNDQYICKRCTDATVSIESPEHLEFVAGLVGRYGELEADKSLRAAAQEIRRLNRVIEAAIEMTKDEDLMVFLGKRRRGGGR